jgi:hypothetical protein
MVKISPDHVLEWFKEISLKVFEGDTGDSRDQTRTHTDSQPVKCTYIEIEYSCLRGNYVTILIKDDLFERFLAADIVQSD